MKKLRIFETFAGIGAQNKAFKNVAKKHNVEIESAGISEWYIDAIVAYAKTHHKKEYDALKAEIEAQDQDPKAKVKYARNKEEILKEYENTPGYVFSSDSKKPSTMKNVKEAKLKDLYIANIVNSNFGSIVDLKGEDLPENIDIFTYSFPCQAISLQGKQGGLEKNSETTSSLVWQVLRVMEEAKAANKLPKILLMENVKALFSSKFIETWSEIKEILSSYGYNTYDTTINALDKGSVQRRERVFAISVLKEYDKGFQFNDLSHKTTNHTIREVLEEKADEKYHMNDLKKHMGDEEFTMKSSGISSLKLQNYTTFASENILYSIDGKAPTITASGANSRIKIIDQHGHLRQLTPLELWKLMGFEESDFDPNREMSKATLCRLAGNSISVEILEDIFEDILKIIK
jgi:DNA (cytosine-5)-methyltransferase 1